MSTENRLEVQAQRKHVGHPAQKVRLVVNQVRGMRAEEALITLDFMTQAAAKEVYKVVASALANAEQNEGLARRRYGYQRDLCRRGTNAQMATFWRSWPLQADFEAFLAYHGGAARALTIRAVSRLFLDD